jgi:hypothetical protein
MSNIIPIPKHSDPTLGGCPTCGRSSGVLNLERVHWGYCIAHGIKWCIGSNLFSGWRDETKKDWEHNGLTLAGFTDASLLINSERKST